LPTKTTNRALPEPALGTSSENGAVAKASALRSVFANWAGLGINALLSLIVTPILVHGLGSLYFGMYMLVAAVLDSCGLLDFGMRTAMFRFLARYVGSGEREELDRTFASGIVIACASTLLIVLAAVAAVFFMPRFFVVAPADLPVFRALLLLSGGSVATAFLSQNLGTYLCAFRRFDFYNLNSASIGILRASLIVLVLHLHHGVISVAGVTLCCSLLSLIVSSRLIRIADPALRFSLRIVSKARIRELLSFSGNAFLGTLGDQLRFFIDSVVIGRVLGIAFITPFVIPGRLMVLFREMGFSLASPLSGLMSEHAGRSDNEALAESFLRATRLCLLLSLFVSVLLLVNGASLIRFWVGSRYSSSYPLMLVLLSGYFLMLAQQPSVDLLLAQGRHQLRGWWNLGEGAANLALSVYWGMRYGLIGIALGTAVPMIVVQVLIQPWYALRTIALPPDRYLREALGRPLLVLVAVLAACAATRPWQHAYSAGWLLFSASWQATLFLMLAWRFALTSNEREHFLLRMSGVLRRVPAE
jgi:O-antigen/teichoic acid export membrane protein